MYGATAAVKPIKTTEATIEVAISVPSKPRRQNAEGEKSIPKDPAQQRRTSGK
jgi:hypothetical protein